MESNSASNVESHNNLTETPDVGEKKSEVNDSNIVYFDCKNCFNTFTIHRNQENVDPNIMEDICKNCKAKQLFQGALLSEEASESIRNNKYSPAEVASSAAAAATATANFDATNLSLLISNQGDVGFISCSSGEPHFCIRISCEKHVCNHQQIIMLTVVKDKQQTNFPSTPLVLTRRTTDIRCRHM